MNNEPTFLKIKRSTLFIIIAILAVVLSACANDGSVVKSSEEETGTEYGLNEGYNEIRNGARLVLIYDRQCNSFNGFVENTTDNIIKQVRVEVHLSNGVELGQTTPTDLNPGESMDVSLSATNKDFDGWTAHPEVGESDNGEHGNGEGDSEHGEGGERGHNVGESD